MLTNTSRAVANIDKPSEAAEARSQSGGGTALDLERKSSSLYPTSALGEMQEARPAVRRHRVRFLKGNWTGGVAAGSRFCK